MSARGQGWDLHGWRRLTAHDDAPLVAAREELIRWLTEVPEPWRTSWRGRLTNDLDHPHCSVRLELFLHHYLQSLGWQVEIEPGLPCVANHPDFRATRNEQQIIVEAKAVFEKDTIRQQDERLAQLAGQLSQRLSRRIFITQLSALPPSLPNRRIAAHIEKQADTTTENTLELKIQDSHQGIHYELEVIVLPQSQRDNAAGGVAGIMGQAYAPQSGIRLRGALEEKANKHGNSSGPFLIVIWPVGFLTKKDEAEAILGDQVWTISNTAGSKTATPKRTPNGLFTVARGGEARFSRVSAVMVYRFKWEDEPPHSHRHLMRVYHNPYAEYPLKTDVFPGVPQMAVKWREGDGQMEWINGEPE